MSDVDALVEQLYKRERDEARQANVALSTENEALRAAVKHHSDEILRMDVERAKLQGERDSLQLQMTPHAQFDGLMGAHEELHRLNGEQKAANAKLRARLAVLEPIAEIARRWCNRPVSVTKDWLQNDAEMFYKLHAAVHAAAEGGQ